MHAARDKSSTSALPRLSIVSYCLTPYFAYGAGYFAFLFADRFAAGAAIPFASGLFFGVDLEYQHSMDAALLTFLLNAPTVEYLNVRFMRAWTAHARQVGFGSTIPWAAQLKRRYQRCCATIGAASLALGAALWLLRGARADVALSGAVMLGGITGYLLLSIALFNSVLLFSIRRPYPVVRALWPALLVNVVVGYVISKAMAPRFAIVGLVAGALLFAWRSGRSALLALSRPDYSYFGA
jgi:hypothetical protein